MTASLENRYRRLLVLFPRDHRLLYEEEMIGVLMADAEPGRGRPSLRDRADLVRSAAVVRLRRTGGALLDEPWRQAAQALLLFGAMVLLAVGLRKIALEGAAGIRWPESRELDGIGVGTMVRPALWSLVIVATLAGWRRSAAVLALAAVGAEIARVVAWYAFSPSQVLRTCWMLTFAVMVAAAAAWLIRGERPPRPRGLWFVVAASVALVAGGVADVFLLPWPGGLYTIFLLQGQLQVRTGGVFYLVAAVLVAWAWWRQPGPVRARMLAFGAPVVAMLILVPVAFSGFMFSSQQFDTPIPLAPVQWVLLVAVPLLAFAVAVVALHRWERLHHLIQLGREAEEQFRGRQLG
jgi:hypothetical protein